MRICGCRKSALGMNMSWQSVPRMIHLIGPARTKQAVILADQRISAAEAYEWGLVEEVAEPGRAFDSAMAHRKVSDCRSKAGAAGTDRRWRRCRRRSKRSPSCL